jgi:hypothetical protein
MEVTKGREDGRSRVEEAGPNVFGDSDIGWEAEAVNLTVVIVYPMLGLECAMECLAY